MTAPKALFLDRDGVINVDTGFVWQAEKFVFNDGVFEACRRARALDYLLVVVTNQSGIGRGLYTEDDFHNLSDWMCSRFAAEGVEIAKVCFAPTHPIHGQGRYRVESADRKPGPGMILKAQAEFGLDLGESALVGDRETDIRAALAAGVCHKLLIPHHEEAPKVSQADAVVRSLSEAIDWLEGAESRVFNEKT